MESMLGYPETQRLHDRVSELEGALADALQDLALTRAWIRLVYGRTAPAAEPAAAVRAPEAAPRCAN